MFDRFVALSVRIVMRASFLKIGENQNFTADCTSYVMRIMDMFSFGPRFWVRTQRPNFYLPMAASDSHRRVLVRSTSMTKAQSPTFLPLLLVAVLLPSVMPLASTVRSAMISKPIVRRVAVSQRIVALPEETWRSLARQHTERVRSLLGPGLTAASDPLNSGSRRRGRDGAIARGDDGGPAWTALDPKNPVYNFLIEYYGLKGMKGPRRLARWSPEASLARVLGRARNTTEKVTGTDEPMLVTEGPAIESARRVAGGDGRAGGVLLLGATEDDIGDGTLHLRGANLVKCDNGGGGGILYSPALFYGLFDSPERGDEKSKAASPYLWYRSVLASTYASEPVLHCHGLHEWAMQYYPPGAPPPPSGKYQSHLPLRVSREVINAAVERKGIHCTHVDALRFFAPAAAPLNHHGSSLERTDQLRLEQKGCIHANMDLLKMTLRLQPFVGADMVGDALEAALESRKLDVEASPYDASGYGLGAIPVETESGREEYRRRQMALMDSVQPVRERLLTAYDAFLDMSFEDQVLGISEDRPEPERFARAEPGGPPWRKNLIEH